MGADIDGEAAGDWSGYSVALSSDGTILAIGASRNDATAINAGHVRVWQYSSDQWTQLGGDIDAEGSDEAGKLSLSSDGTMLAIGASYNDGSTGGPGSTSYDGHCRVYQFSSGSWTQLGSDIDGEAAGDRSGYAVALSKYGNRVAIGAIWNDATGSNAGHVRVHELVGRLPLRPHRRPKTAAPSSRSARTADAGHSWLQPFTAQTARARDAPAALVVVVGG